MKVIIEKVKQFIMENGIVKKSAQTTKMAVVKDSKKSKKVVKNSTKKPVKKVSKVKKSTKSKSKKK